MDGRGRALALRAQLFFIPILQGAINRRTAERIKTVRSLAVEIVGAGTGHADHRERTYRGWVGDVYRLNMQIYRRKFGMNFLMNLMHQLGVIGVLAVGGWLLLQGKTEVGTIVAFISGLARTNDPWNDLVDFSPQSRQCGREICADRPGAREGESRRWRGSRDGTSGGVARTMRL